MSALEATVLLTLKRLLPFPLPSFLLLLLQLPLPCPSLIRSLSLLKRLRLPTLPCRRPLRRHPRRARAMGGRPPPSQQLLRYCPPCGPSPHIIPFLALSPFELPSATLPPAATSTTVLLSVAPRRAVPSSTRCAAACCPALPSAPPPCAPLPDASGQRGGGGRARGEGGAGCGHGR